MFQYATAQYGTESPPGWFYGFLPNIAKYRQISQYFYTVNRGDSAISSIVGGVFLHTLNTIGKIPPVRAIVSV